jgi:hypothetical protein
MAVEGFDERSRMVTHVSFQPTFPDECFNFRLVQLDGHTADALPAPVPMQAHSRRGRRNGRLLNTDTVFVVFTSPSP